MNAIPGKYFNVLFWILIGVSLLQFLLFRYAPSLDGPQHLHNAYVLKDLIFKNGSIPDFYAINDLPVGYWTSHLLLSIFTLVFPPWLAEKMLLITYVTGVALAYRYFLGSSGMEINPFAQYLIFPFIPSFFFLAGYYAFSFGIIVFLLAFGYWNTISGSVRLPQAIRFSLLLLLLYFTNGLVFTFFLISFFIFYISEILIDLLANEERRETIRRLGIRTLYTTASFIPVLIVLFIYSKSVISIQSGVSGNPADLTDLLRQLITMRILIGFHHEMESVATVPLFLALLLVGLTVMIQSVIRLDQKKAKLGTILQDKANIFLLLAFVFFMVYILNPDQYMAGIMTLRAGFFFFLFLIMWIPFNRIPLPVNLLMGGVILFAVIYNQALMPVFYKPQVSLIKELQELDSHIEQNATIYTLRESDNWLHVHYGLYIGLSNHLVNLNNPQCYGPFPIVWDEENIPAMFAGDLQIKLNKLDRVDPAKHEARQVDYITVFYHDRFLKKEDNAEWKKVLDNDYELVHLTSRGTAAVYRLR